MIVHAVLKWNLPTVTRFYFHIHDGTHAFLDEGGLDLP
jgi:hypothetical protein